MPRLSPVLVLVAVLAAVAAARPSPPAGAGVEIHGPLEEFNMTNCFYRDMGISLTLSVENLLGPVSPPPWCPARGPRDGSLTCSCSLEPRGWWPNATWSLVLGPGETWSTTMATTVPGDAALGPAGAGFACLCEWREWCRYTTVSTVAYRCCCGGTTVNGTWTCTSYGYCCSSTITVTRTSTATPSTALTATKAVAIIPRRVNETLLALELNATLLQVLVDYPVPGQSSALVNMTVRLYNFGLGLRNSTLPMQQGMLLLHNLTVLVNNVPVVTCRGFCAPAQPLPVNSTEPAPSITGSTALILEPPPRPGNEYTFNVTVCYTEDKPEPVRTCISDNVTVELPFSWRRTVYVADDCGVLNEAWEVVPVNETGYRTIIVEDRVKPSISLKDYCIVAAAGGCEPIKLSIYHGGSLAASRSGRGEARWCPVEPGVYTAVAVDSFNNTAVKTFTVTWTAGPPPALKKALLGLAGVIIAVAAALYILAGGGWPLRGP